jgi:transposase
LGRWTFVEAANFAIRFNSKIKSFNQRKKAKTKAVVAIKAVAHKLCRACYHIMKDQVAFDVTKAFGQK